MCTHMLDQHRSIWWYKPHSCANTAEYTHTHTHKQCWLSKSVRDKFLFYYLWLSTVSITHVQTFRLAGSINATTFSSIHTNVSTRDSCSTAGGPQDFQRVLKWFWRRPISCKKRWYNANNMKVVLWVCKQLQTQHAERTISFAGRATHTHGQQR